MRFRSWGLAFAGLLAGVLVSACGTEHGQVETTSTAVPVPLAPPPAAGAVIPGGGTLLPPVVTRPPVLPNYPKTIQESGASPAVLSLYRQAQEAQAKARFDQADELLRRAVHIEPRNPFVWQQIAIVCMSLQHPDEAEAAATKSNALAHGNPYVEAGNWRVIAGSRQARGNLEGAQQANVRADQIAQSVSGTP